MEISSGKHVRELDEIRSDYIISSVSFVNAQSGERTDEEKEKERSKKKIGCGRYKYVATFSRIDWIDRMKPIALRARDL